MNRAERTRQIALAMTERELEDNVLELAQSLRWLRFHALPARSKDGERWRTHQRGEVGFPDLCLVHTETGKIAIFELKAERGTLTPAQQEWLSALELNPCESHVASGVWRPSDWLSGIVGETLVWGTRP